MKCGSLDTVVIAKEDLSVMCSQQNGYEKTSQEHILVDTLYLGSFLLLC